VVLQGSLRAGKPAGTSYHYIIVTWQGPEEAILNLTFVTHLAVLEGDDSCPQFPALSIGAADQRWWRGRDSNPRIPPSLVFSRVSR
jgi:hypothetical protein